MAISVMDKIKAKTAELKEKKELEIPGYVSLIDYENCGIIEEDIKSKLINCEKKAVHHGNEMAKNIMELSKVFSEAQGLLSNHSGGTFKIWFESLGFKKDFVYMCLKRNNLYLEVEDQKVFMIPERAIKTISKIKDKVESRDILEIVNSEKPVQAAKEKEIELSGNPTTGNDIEEAVIIESEEESSTKEIQEIKDRIAEYKSFIKELENQLAILENKKQIKK